jgi:hypothetical protein
VKLYACKTLEAVIYVACADIGEALAESTRIAQASRPAQHATQREIRSIHLECDNVVILGERK